MSAMDRFCIESKRSATDGAGEHRQILGMQSWPKGGIWHGFKILG